MPEPHTTDSSIPRRKFIQMSAATVGAAGALGLPEHASGAEPAAGLSPASGTGPKRPYNAPYSGAYLNRVAFPLGGIGAGMICLEGTGAFSHVSLRNRPEVFNEPLMFAAIAIKGSPRLARVVEGQVPAWKLFGSPGTGNGAGGNSFGLPRFKEASFEARFPFGAVSLSEPQHPIKASVTGWSPFEPGDADNSSMPVAALEYQFTNRGTAPVDAVFSFNARNFMRVGQNDMAVRPVQGGFILWGGPGKDKPWEEGAFCATVSDPAVKVNHAWFRGGWFDPLTMAWNEIASAAPIERPPVTEGGPSPGASLFVPLQIGPGETKTVAVRLAWFSGRTNLRIGNDPAGASSSPDNHRPWYAERFTDINSVNLYWRDHYDELRASTKRFSQCFYQSTLPPEVLEAVAANLTILKSPTVLRQADGKLWAWEGCSDNSGCCHGSCTHVWNYAQAIPHLFPSLERTLRETEFGPSQSEQGHQTFRASLPIRPVEHTFHAAADGQLGGIMKVFREWRISGDTEWLRRLWPKVRKSLDYCIETWDPGHKGILEEPHHNTYDIEFWGPDGMCTSFYLGALKAASVMTKALGDEVPLYSELFEKGIQATETDLYDGEYFIQKIQWKNLRAKNPVDVTSFGGAYSPEAMALMEKEGPKYQVRHRLPVGWRPRIMAGRRLRCGTGPGPREGRQPSQVRSPI
ncbi:MAG: GH116 family glycosyl-hydrolase [Verrucomicrobiia bacterium]